MNIKKASIEAFYFLSVEGIPTFIDNQSSSADMVR